MHRQDKAPLEGTAALAVVGSPGIRIRGIDHSIAIEIEGRVVRRGCTAPGVQVSRVDCAGTIEVTKESEEVVYGCGAKAAGTSQIATQ